MKSVGKQLQEARAARNWTPEMASRETKIKVDRLRDLEADDYTHFSSPAYARGFVRTYARALNLDEYKILRQLDNKLPEEDHSVVHDSGIAYTPVPATPSRMEGVSGAGGGLLVVMGLGFVITLVLGFVLFEAYRSGDLPRYFGQSTVATAPAPVPTGTAAESPARALPVDPNAVNASTTNRALPVNPAEAASAASPATATPAATTAATDVPGAVKALPVDPSELTPPAVAPTAAVAATSAAPPPAPPVVATTSAPDAGATNAPPRALPVDPSELAAIAAATPTTEAVPPPAPTPPPKPKAPSLSARGSANESPVLNDAGLPIAPAVSTNAMTAPAAPGDPSKRLVLTASRDSFLRVTAEDAADLERVLYASVLHTGQSVAFDGRKFSINVGVPSAVNITLDGVNYGPHSDEDAPETFTVESHQP